MLQLARPFAVEKGGHSRTPTEGFSPHESLVRAGLSPARSLPHHLFARRRRPLPYGHGSESPVTNRLEDKAAPTDCETARPCLDADAAWPITDARSGGRTANGLVLFAQTDLRHFSRFFAQVAGRNAPGIVHLTWKLSCPFLRRPVLSPRGARDLFFCPPIKCGDAAILPESGYHNRRESSLVIFRDRP